MKTHGYALCTLVLFPILVCLSSKSEYFLVFSFKVTNGLTSHLQLNPHVKFLVQFLAFRLEIFYLFCFLSIASALCKILPWASTLLRLTRLFGRLCWLTSESRPLVALFLESDSFDLCFSSFGTPGNVLSLKPAISFESCGESLWYDVSREDFLLSVSFLALRRKGLEAMCFWKTSCLASCPLLLMH